MEKLTKRQSGVMDFLRSYLLEHGYPPTVREIGEHFGFSWPAARAHLRAIAKKGFIRLVPHKSRGIEIPGMMPGEAVEVPVAGRIRAGRPALAVQNVEEHIVVDRGLFGDEGTFALRVVGDSMIEAGIFDGDYAVVRPQRTVTSGEIAAVFVGDEGEATVKRVRVRKNSVTLLPANRALSPMTYRPEEIVVVGKVVGIVRKL